MPSRSAKILRSPAAWLTWKREVVRKGQDQDTELYKLLTTKPSEVEHAAETEAWSAQWPG